MKDLRELLVVGRVVELADGEKYFVLPDRLINKTGWVNLNDYSYRLERLDIDFSIVKVFNAPITSNGESAWSFRSLSNNGLEVIWERAKNKIYSDDEIAIAKVLNRKFKYIARDEIGDLFAYTEKPYKNEVAWRSDVNSFSSMSCFNDLYQQITFEDNEPTLISDIINSKNCQ